MKRFIATALIAVVLCCSSIPVIAQDLGDDEYVFTEEELEAFLRKNITEAVEKAVGVISADYELKLLDKQASIDKLNIRVNEYEKKIKSQSIWLQVFPWAMAGSLVGGTVLGVYIGLQF